MIELLAKYFSGNFTDKEKQEVFTWRCENNQNAEMFFEYSSIWHHKELVEEVNSIQTEKTFEKIFRDSRTEIPIVQIDSKTSFSQFYKYAAVFALAILGSFLLYKNNSDPVLISTVAKQQLQELVLEDGSKVFLSSNARISYPEKFAKDGREVSLEGKAFFQIEKDQNRPFVITTSESKVKVLGTSFLVNADMNSHETEVVVETGKVSVSDYNANNSVELLPGEATKVVGTNSNLLKFKNENTNYLSWKSKILNFENENLQNVLRIIEDTYSIKIQASTKQIQNCDLTATYTEQSVQSILEIVSQTFGLTSKKVDSDTYQLSGAGCSE
jgi:transmembrane sensor